MTTTPSHTTQPQNLPAPLDEETPRYFNRDVSWLEFNRRVLAQATDEQLPLLERLRFLAIFTSNLDEFFMKRVGLIKRQIHAGVTTPSPDGLLPRQQLAAIRELAGELQALQHQMLYQHLLPRLAEQEIVLTKYTDLSGRDRGAIDEWYRHNAFSALTPLAVDPTHRFPFISNLSENLGVLATPNTGDKDPHPWVGIPALRQPEQEDVLFARVKLPPSIRRFIAVPGPKGASGKRFVLLHDVLRNNLDDLFPGMKIVDTVFFRVTRSAGIQKDDILDTPNLLESVEADLKQRKFARVVRLEIEPDAPQTLRRWLVDKLNLDVSDVYENPSAIDYNSLLELVDIDRPELKHRPWKAAVPPQLRAPTRPDAPSPDRSPAMFFAAIRKQDVLVHHPYESFNASVERFIAAAAIDPDVITIKQTLYRTSPDSPFIESLVRAAENGKQVACLVELRARFDEGRNVRFARKLEKAGVHVAYGVMGLKTHCKTSLVVRKERQGLRCYAHFGTGNYHPKTAQLYTDVGLLTCDPVLTHDLVHLFNYLTGLSSHQTYESLLVAPINMRQKFNQLIDREAANARKGRPARIIAKINSMEDRDVTERLYAASQAGVKITLIVRGFCCLRPGVPGLSENINVISVVGRFLEHSRIFYFAAGQEDPLDGEWLISSADWMYRNLSNRVEAAVPVREQAARARLQEIFDIMLADQRCAWDLRVDGGYDHRAVAPDAAAESVEAMGTFESLMKRTLAVE